MGIVYRATQLDLGRPVAIKVIAADRARDPGLRTRFSLEARLAAAIDHPNLVPVHAAGEDDGRLYIVMRYVAGTDLHRALKRDGPLAPARAARIVAQVAAGLDAAHAAGLVHRDVKPANVLLAGEYVYLGDFGLSRLQGAGERITESGAWIGTVDYMSPEHLRGEPCDARSDVYALGCVLFAALCGEPPFRRDTVPQTMSAHLHQPPPLPSERTAVPAEFDRVIERALAKRPEDRYPSAGDLGRAALAAAAGEPVTEQERTVATGAAAPAELTTAMPTELLARTTRGPEAPPEVPWEPPAHAPVLGRRRAWVPRRGAPGPLGGGGLSPPLGPPMLLPRRAPPPRPPPPPPGGGGRGAAGADAAGPNAQLSGGEVREAADAFAGAIGSEDSGALARVLARDVKRVFPGDSQRGRASVLATYRSQFSENKITGYELSDLDVSGGRAGRAAGRYELRRGGRDATGGRGVGGVQRGGGPAEGGGVAAPA